MKKISFTSTELKTIHNTKFFKVKAEATKKIDTQFAVLRDVLKEEIAKNKQVFPKEVDVINGKIFRGENYLGLPYLVLDYPKQFSKSSVFSFRTMFWWGNFYSFTLHLQGIALENKREFLINNISKIKKKHIYICVNNNPWQYHYQKDNYLPIDRFSDSEIKKMFLKKEFIKLSAKVPVNKYKELNRFCKETFAALT